MNMNKSGSILMQHQFAFVIVCLRYILSFAWNRSFSVVVVVVLFLVSKVSWNRKVLQWFLFCFVYVWHNLNVDSNESTENETEKHLNCNGCVCVCVWSQSVNHPACPSTEKQEKYDEEWRGKKSNKTKPMGNERVKGY